MNPVKFYAWYQEQDIKSIDPPDSWFSETENAIHIFFCSNRDDMFEMSQVSDQARENTMLFK